MKVTGKVIFNGISLAIGILGIALSIYFYKAQKQFKAISFVADPKHALVLSPQHPSTSKLTILDQDRQKITRNIYLAELFLWNSGTETIRKTDVIVPLAVEIPKGMRLLDLQSIRVSRPDVTQAVATLQQIHESPRRTIAPENKTFIQFEFQVLEPGEGIRISCLYEGQGDEDFLLEGGVSGIRKITDSKQIAQDEQWIALWRKKMLPVILALGGGLFFGMIFLLRKAWNRMSKRMFPQRAERVEEILAAIAVSTFALLFLWGIAVALLQPWIHPEKVMPENIRTLIPGELTRN